jgi:hypothetical protein
VETLSIQLLIGFVDLLGDVLRGCLHGGSGLEKIRMPLLDKLAVRTAYLHGIRPRVDPESAVIFVDVLAHAGRAGARDQVIPLQSAQSA